MKKEQYIKPSLELERFNTMDIITTSNGSFDDRDPGDTDIEWGT